LDEAIQVSKPI